MPSKNTVKEFEENCYYHVFNRGVEKRDIFIDDQDYLTFLGLLKQYLTGSKRTNLTNQNRHPISNISEEIDLLAYCLMPNHFHMLVYIKNKDALTKLMRRVATGYVMYFNHKYQRVGGLFQGRYKASKITSPAYLDHISRYIHLNPAEYLDYPYSSIGYYRGNKSSEWLDTQQVLSLFNNDARAYLNFVDSYIEQRDNLAEIKQMLAD